MSKFYIGCHLSTTKGFEAMGKQALEIGANTFQFFTRNPRGGSAKELDLVDLEKLLTLIKDHDFAMPLAHAPYTLNACSPKEDTRKFAKEMFKDDLNRLEYMKGCFYNFHPGSFVSGDLESGTQYIISMLNECMTKEQSTYVLLETMAGKGSEIGRNFTELKNIIDNVICNEKLGVCLDTCHVFDGGYDIVNNLDGVLEEFDNIIGLDKLKCIHLNDSKNPIGSAKDRHEKIGEGNIGLVAIENIINHPKLKDIPFYLETPNEIDGYAKEIALLKTLRKD